MLEHVVTGGLQAGDDHRGVQVNDGQRLQVTLDDNPLCCGDGVAVGVVCWVAELMGNRRNEAFRDVMLQHLGLVVDLVEFVAQLLHQVQFDEPMPPEQVQRDLLPFRGERHAFIFLIVEIAGGFQAAGHVRHGRGFDL